MFKQYYISNTIYDVAMFKQYYIKSPCPKKQFSVLVSYISQNVNQSLIVQCKAIINHM